jgi:hypothetical protein
MFRWLVHGTKEQDTDTQLFQNSLYRWNAEFQTWLGEKEGADDGKVVAVNNALAVNVDEVLPIGTALYGNTLEPTYDEKEVLEWAQNYLGVDLNIISPVYVDGTPDLESLWGGVIDDVYDEEYENNTSEPDNNDSTALGSDEDDNELVSDDESNTSEPDNNDNTALGSGDGDIWEQEIDIWDDWDDNDQMQGRLQERLYARKAQYIELQRRARQDPMGLSSEQIEYLMRQDEAEKYKPPVTVQVPGEPRTPGIMKDPLLLRIQRDRHYTRKTLGSAARHDPSGFLYTI